MNGGQPAAVSVAWTGASGMVYGVRLVECLLAAGIEVPLMISRAARVVLARESGLELPGNTGGAEAALREHYGDAAGRLHLLGPEQWTSVVASGSSAPRAMALCPCSMGTLGSVAGGLSDNLIERAADVVLKEGGRLVLVPRETPVSAIHLENMLKLARLGVTILPASPGFYHRPAVVDDLVDQLVARILDHLGVAHDLGPRWGYGDGG
ncbi:MAG: flavin prenyltransferase UbiX [Pseudomonadota bacterium]